MKKLKAFIAVLICAALLPALPALRSAAYDGGLFIDDPASLAADLGITEEQLTSLLGDCYDAITSCKKDINIYSYNAVYSQAAFNELNYYITNYFPLSLGYVTNLRASYIGNYLFQIFFVYKVGYDESEYRARLAECEAVAAELTAGITPDVPDAIKVAVIHDRLAAHCEYSGDYNPNTGKYADDDYTAYGALVNRKAVCQGYSHAFAYLLDLVGVKSYYCPSRALGHIWNIVIVDGVKYHVDVTWDDPTFGGLHAGGDVPGRLKHWDLLASSNRIITESAPGAGDAHVTDAYQIDYDTSPDSTLYENAFWNTSQTQLCLLNGTVYYLDYNQQCIFSYNYTTGVTQFVSDLSGVIWLAGPNGSYWPGCYTRLDSDGQYLYFSLPDGIYRFDPISNYAEVVFRPDTTGYDYYNVYGFELTGRTITCITAGSPNIYEKSDMIYYTYELDPIEYAEPVVSGIENGGVYEGEVTISWDVGEGTLDGSPFANGGTVSDVGPHRFSVVNGDKTVMISFTINAAQQTKKGDMDGDGAITVADALKALRIAAKLIQPTPADMRLGDIDADGVITVADALKILRVAAKLATSL